MPSQMKELVAALVLLSGATSASQVEVVLAHHNEDLSWLSRIPEDVQIRVYTKGPQAESDMPAVSQALLLRLPNIGREAHTYLHHIVQNYDRLADWTVFTQAGAPSFGYKGHRSGGGHLLAGDDFANYLVPHSSGSRFVYTSVVQLPSMNHLLRAAYCINDELLEGGGASMCPKEASQWTPWWDIGNFREFVSSKVESQHGEEIMEFYRKYINPSYSRDDLLAFFPQGARFAVSRDVIQRRPKSDYLQLLTTLSKDKDPYAGYFMEWLWSELFLGHQEPCPVPAKVVPVSHAAAMDSLVQRFPKSVARQLRSTSGNGSSSECACAGVSGGVSGSVSGSISGGISGSDCTCGGISGDISGGTNVTRVAGTMEVELTVDGTLSQEVVEGMFQRAIAAALEIDVDFVSNLVASEVGQGSGLRRLQSMSRKRYEVSYEVIVPSHLDAVEVVQKANSIAVSGSPQSQLFREALAATNGVSEVHEVMMKTPAHTVREGVTTAAPGGARPEDDEKSSVTLIIVLVLGALVVVCMVTSAILLRRKMGKTEPNSAPASYDVSV